MVTGRAAHQTGPMENSALTHMLLQAQVGAILVQADRDRLASKVPAPTPGVLVLLMSRLARLWRAAQPRSLAALRHEVASR